MSVSTKGAVITECKDVFFVAQRVEATLRKVMVGALVTEMTPLQRIARTAIHVECLAASSGLRFEFLLGEERRSLHLYFACDADHRARGSSALALLLNDWGASRTLMRELLRGLSMLGVGYINESDTNDEGYVRIEEPPMSYLDAVACGYERLCPTTLQAWVRQAERGLLQLSLVNIEAVLGMPAQLAEEILGLSYEAGMERLKRSLDK